MSRERERGRERERERGRERERERNPDAMAHDDIIIDSLPSSTRGVSSAPDARAPRPPCLPPLRTT